jgi:putative flippase GtrA
MNWLMAIFHIFIGSTLSGIAIIVALVTGYSSAATLIAAAAIGFIIAFPVTYFVGKAIFENE